MILTGATAMVSQIIFLREFLIVFYGNEISIGIILASWLIWGAVGSACLGVLADRLQGKIQIFAILQVFLAILLPVTLFFIRSSRMLLGVSIGEIIGYTPMICLTFFILALPCAVLGFMFTLACRIHRDMSDSPAGSIANIYVLEAIGALAGGILVSYFLIRFIDPVSILLIAAFLNVGASIIVQACSKNRIVIRNLTITFLVLTLIFFISFGGKWIREVSLGNLWSGFDVLASKDSVYGNITVTKRGGTRSFYESGLHLYTVPDKLSSEEIVHFTMLEQGEAQNVLLLGGGAGGLLNEILKYPVESVDYVELDPMIIEMAEKYLARDDSEVLSNKRVRIINGDARFFIKNTEKKYDCIIISFGDPYTAQINRFYTLGFFREAKRTLTDKGVISFALTSSANYISDELGKYLGSIYGSLSAVFPQVIIIPGDTSYFIASKALNMLTYDSDILMDRMSEKSVQADYVQEYYLFDKMSEGRVKYAEDNIKKASDSVDVNKDFKPVAYYYATVFWSTQFDLPILRNVFNSVNRENIWLGAILFCFLFLAFILLSGRRRNKRAIMLAIATTGFAEIIFQIAVILSFQIVYGYVFYKIGVIMTSFMVGLALGAWFMTRHMERMKNGFRFFKWTQVSICIYPLILPVVFIWLLNAETSLETWLGSNIVFPFLPIVSGLIGGMQFPLANKLYLECSEKTGQVAGFSYGLDLFGACIGALIAAAFLVPILGIFATCFLVALINVTVLSLLLLK